MPVNSFENFPMSWKPNKAKLKPPLYLSIAEALEQDILNGELTPNTKLPPQRELADFLDVNLSTITRAFKLCEAKGLIYAAIGSGTFISPNAVLPKWEKPAEDFIELGLIRPYYQFNSIVADAARTILQGEHSDRLFEFNFTLGNIHHKRTAQKWLSTFHVDASCDHIILTAGTQNALTISLLALFQPGDKIVTDTFTYSNFITLAKQLHIQLISVESDEHGMIPDLLERQCHLSDMKGIYLMPSCNNPTGITIPLERRKELSRIIQEQNLILIEDDTYGFIAEEKDIPFFSLIPDHTVYLHGMSKSLSAGLRIAYMVFPHRLQQSILSTANNINLKIPLLNAEIASKVIEDGIADNIIQQKRILSKERNLIFKKYFPDNLNTNPYSFFQWLPLPSGYNGYQFELQAKERGIHVLCSDRFAVGKTTQTAIRIAICSPYTTNELETGLLAFQKLLAENQKISDHSEFII